MSHGEVVREPSKLEKTSQDLSEARAALEAAFDEVRGASKKVEECAAAQEEALMQHIGLSLPMEGDIRATIDPSTGEETGVLDWEADPMNGHPSVAHFAETVRIVDVRPGLRGVVVDLGPDSPTQYRVNTESISAGPPVDNIQELQPTE